MFSVFSLARYANFAISRSASGEKLSLTLSAESSAAYWVAAVLAAVVLRRRVGGLDGRRVAGTSVRVGIEERGGYVVLTVADDGPGIPTEQFDHVFDRFSRGDASRRRTSGTSGLGLPIAAAIVEAFGGNIRVASGNGTTFTVTLPDADQR